ncbi:Component of the origin recognition complex (ORC) [Fragilaria crotonensis]|nr:Component of the origin recognition complex (ORC) [Fragilaria crotonensis]
MQSDENMLSRIDGIVNRLGDGSRRKRVYSEMTKADDDLYRLLVPCLVEHTNNVAAFVMGPRGCGKNRLVENCLLRMDQSKFHTLRLNGLVIRGNDVGSAVVELVRQLSELALVDAVDSDLLRLKRTNFTWNLELLDEIFRLARVDNRPILIIMDEMDAFAGSSAHLDVTTRQLLLYHILDRVAARGSSLCFIGISSHLESISLLEKRVRSRAEGHPRPFCETLESYASLIELLMQKFDGAGALRSMVQGWLSMTIETNDAAVVKLRQRFERSYMKGNDLRWFARVVSIALALFREEARVALSDENNAQTASCAFHPKYLIEALSIMDAPTTGGEHESTATEPRICVLKDLSEPQVSLLLAARRLLTRDGKADVPKPLTFDRILNEYQSFKRGNSNRDIRLLLRSFTQMLEMDVFRPSSDHSGGGALQYEYGWSLEDMDATSLSKMPLHLPYELEAELTRALKDQLLDCSTALQEWGRKEN